MPDWKDMMPLYTKKAIAKLRTTFKMKYFVMGYLVSGRIDYPLADKEKIDNAGDYIAKDDKNN
ncbi:hypothetical protein GCM10017764_10060 [Sphingobacterium griseoflavum]|uniref:Uncharacterized protein n=1 Tax=Sphingobacterium griseoflavum TaxID=1474952 RepID=A0ABQ3HUJ8_9SPHI|nr:hypothetical protein GCM10017764_10060 [Sphingobacterium griseoflavum]